MRLFNLFKKNKETKSTFYLSSLNEPLFGTYFKSSLARKFDTNTIINACATFIRRASSEPVLRFFKNENEIRNSVTNLLNNPNEAYSEVALRQAIAVDLAFNGNSYLLKIKTLGGKIFELWWLPSACVEPKSKSNPLTLDYYQVTLGGASKKIAKEDIIHFRDGVDAENPLKGYSLFKSLLSEVLTDEEAKEYTYWFLANKGVIGSIISPKFESDQYAKITIEEAEELKKSFQNDFTGINRGKAFVSTFPLTVESVSVNPDEMLVEKIRDLPEERISAVLNIPAAVIGLGTGMQQTKVGATLRELRQQAYDGCILPLLKLIESTYQRNIINELDESITVKFDYSAMKVFEEDTNELHRRVREDFKAGLITLGQASEVLGYQVDDAEKDLRFADLAFGSTALKQQVFDETKNLIYSNMRQRENAFLKLGLDLDEYKNGT